MAEASVRLLDDDAIVLRRTGVRFRLRLRSARFDPDELATWPSAERRLEWVGGRLLYMPPGSDVQQDVCVDVVHTLRT